MHSDLSAVCRRNGKIDLCGGSMDKKTAMANLAREAQEKGVFTGTWLYAENGEIVS